MAIISNRLHEYGKRIIELKPVSSDINQTFYNVERMAKIYDCDVFKMTLKGIEMEFFNEVTVEELKNLYNELLEMSTQEKQKPSTSHLTSEEYNNLEFKTNLSVYPTWSEEESYYFHLYQLDLALATSDTEWARETYDKIQKINFSPNKNRGK